MSLALIDPDITTVPLMAAAESLSEEGYDVEIDELAEPELAIEGLANGTYDVSAEATSPALVAIEQGAPIQIVAEAVGNQWAVYGSEDLTACDDLAGEPVGIFSEGAVATAMVREWVTQECAAGEPEYLVIGGSDVRAQALLSGEIEATALSVEDVVTLEEAGDADFSLLVDFAETLPDLHPQTVYANTEFLDGSQESAQAFITALLDVHEQINADPSHLVDLASTHLDQEPDETAQAIAEAYVDAGLFDAGGLTQEGMQGTVDFFVDAGVVGELDAESVANLSLLD